MAQAAERGIRWDHAGAYRINGEKKFLICGEFHYFRVPHEDWERRLSLWKASGGNCVATYIPWELHEPQEGTILFSDLPCRDLEGFLQLCRKLGLYVLVRPGPYQYSEMRYCGLPEWLVTDYPEILARNLENESIEGASVSYRHPTFLKKVRRWYEAVVPLLARYTVNKDGPIAMVQFDNELMGIHYWFTDAYDCNREGMGIGVPEGAWPRFLKERYGTLEALSEAYGSREESFASVLPIHPPARNRQESRRLKDYQDFYFAHCAGYAKILCDWLRELGMDVPIVHNSPNPNANSTFLETNALMDDRFLLGSDHYYSLNIGWEQNNPTLQYALRCFYSNEMLRLMGFPPTVFELPGGGPSDFPPIMPEDLNAAYYANTALGMKGHNYYIFTGGENPLHLGCTGKIYDYNAPIAADGSLRESYHVMERYHAFLHENEWMSAARMASDVYVGLDWESTRSAYYSAGGFSRAKAWEFTRNGLLLTAFAAGYTPELVDLGKPIPKDKPLLVAGFEEMEAALQEKLVAYVKEGGRLLLGPVLPSKDEQGADCTILAEFLGSAIPDKDYRYAPIVTMCGEEDFPCGRKDIFVTKSAPDGAEILGEDLRNETVITWEKAFPGGGKVVFSGYGWTYGKKDHRRMLSCQLERLGLAPTDRHIVSSNADLWAVLREDGEHAMAFVLNLYSTPRTTTVTVRDGETVKTFSDLHLAPMEVKTLRVK